jgi:hypothetical protein
VRLESASQRERLARSAHVPEIPTGAPQCWESSLSGQPCRSRLARNDATIFGSQIRLGMLRILRPGGTGIRRTWPNGDVTTPLTLSKLRIH